MIEELNIKIVSNENSIKQYKESEEKLKRELNEIQSSVKSDKQTIDNLEKHIVKLEEKIKFKDEIIQSKEDEIEELQRDETLRMQELENAISNCLKSKRKYPKKVQSLS